MLTIEDSKEILEQYGEKFTNDEIALILEFLYRSSQINILQKDNDD